MPSIDFAGTGVIFKPKCIPAAATVASNRADLQYVSEHMDEINPRNHELLHRLFIQFRHF